MESGVWIRHATTFFLARIFLVSAQKYLAHCLNFDLIFLQHAYLVSLRSFHISMNNKIDRCGMGISETGTGGYTGLLHSMY